MPSHNKTLKPLTRGDRTGVEGDRPCTIPVLCYALAAILQVLEQQRQLQDFRGFADTLLMAMEHQLHFHTENCC